MDTSYKRFIFRRLGSDLKETYANAICSVEKLNEDLIPNHQYPDWLCLDLRCSDKSDTTLLAKRLPNLTALHCRCQSFDFSGLNLDFCRFFPKLQTLSFDSVALKRKDFEVFEFLHDLTSLSFFTVMLEENDFPWLLRSLPSGLQEFSCVGLSDDQETYRLFRQNCKFHSLKILRMNPMAFRTEASLVSFCLRCAEVLIGYRY